ncbi:MAG: glycoside hydrolase family 3 protein [Treponema sp.]|jgi:beta-N-acetylhexosaminidase|nr:glycoside hydrolase family 3 protein [Treponema sp.]
MAALFWLPVQGFSLDFNDLEKDIGSHAAALVERMSDEQALAQTFMLGWVGAVPSPLILDWIRDRHIGGVKIFGWNTEDTTKLAETVGVLQAEALGGPFHIPLLVATDQEGGWIRHVKGATSETPGNMAIGASGRPMDAYWSGYYIGRELAVLGINMNFAPTVDVYTNRDSVIIGPRAFGADPVRVGMLGTAFMKGQHAAGIIATAKHYPGHGDTNLDSHGVLPQINASFEQLWERELIPYRLLTKEGLTAIMSGHLAFPNTQAGLTPASLSSWFLQDLLRGTLGFQGIVITDDLMMNGATMSAGSLSQAAKEALLAGNDIIMLSKTPRLYDPIWTRLVDAMDQEPGFRERVRDAARRVLAIKLTYLRGEQAVPWIPDIKKVASNLPDPEGTAFFLNLAARSVTLVKGTIADPADQELSQGNPLRSGTGRAGTAVFPLSPEKAGKVLLAGQYEDFFTVGKMAYPGASAYWYDPEESVGLMQHAPQADTIIFCISNAEGLPFLQSLRGLHKRVIVLSVLSPVHLDTVPWVDGALAVYSYARESFVAGFSVILGRIPPAGTLPLSSNAVP